MGKQSTQQATYLLRHLLMQRSFDTGTVWLSDTPESCCPSISDSIYTCTEQIGRLHARHNASRKDGRTGASLAGKTPLSSSITCLVSKA